MADLATYRWRKVSDIRREFALFELLIGEDVTVLDVGFSDNGIFEVAFFESMHGLIVDWSQFRSVIEEGKKLAEQDRD